VLAVFGPVEARSETSRAIARPRPSPPQIQLQGAAKKLRKSALKSLRSLPR